MAVTFAELVKTDVPRLEHFCDVVMPLVLPMVAFAVTEPTASSVKSYSWKVSI